MGEHGTDLPRPVHDAAQTLIEGLATGSGDAVFGAFNDLVLVVDPDLVVEYANPAASAITGFPREDLVGRGMVELMHPDDLPRAIEAEARVGAPATPVAVGAPMRLRHATTGWRWLDLSSGRVGPADGAHIVVVGRLNDDERTYEGIFSLIADGASLPAVVDALPELGAWRLPAIPFAVACASGPGRHVAGHPAAIEVLRTVLLDEAWLAGLGDDDQPHHGLVADLEPAGRAAGGRQGAVTWVAARVWSRHRTADAIVLAVTDPERSATSVVAERVRRVAGMARLVVEWAAQRAALARAGHTDPVTGVLNRSATIGALTAALGREQPDGQPVALVVCDLDGFSAASAVLGARRGDLALAEAVRRIEAGAGPGAIVGRLGSDAVAVVVRGPDARVAAEDAARRAIGAMGAPLEVDGASVSCGLSAGIAVSDGREHPPTTADQLLARAEAALALARAAGGGRSVTTTV